MTMMMSASRVLRLSRRCDLMIVPAGSNPSARQTVTADWPCSAVYPASPEQAERAGLATVYRMMVVYLATTEVMPNWRLLTDAIEYRVRSVSYWPRAGSRFVELLIEEEQ